MAVATLYLNQTLVGFAAHDLQSDVVVRYMPAATLLGYASCVAYCSTMARDLSEPGALLRHWLLLAVALGASGLAPSAATLVAACFVVGAGAALTQRLLCCATAAMPGVKRSATIGWIIAFGLCGIVATRCCGMAVSELIGWRAVFWLQAAAACIAAIVSVTVAKQGHVSAAGPKIPLPSVRAIWRGERPLRQAAIQQAAVFAAFNMSWAAFMGVGHPAGVAPSPKLALVALCGAATAIAAGRWCARWRADNVASAGVLAITIASVALGSWLDSRYACLGMALLDCGTQAALVSNQARAQAAAVGLPMRGRFAACLTAISFTGGAIGSATGYWLLQRNPPTTLWLLAAVIAACGWLGCGGLAPLQSSTCRGRQQRRRACSTSSAGSSRLWLRQGVKLRLTRFGGAVQAHQRRLRDAQDTPTLFP